MSESRHAPSWVAYYRVCTTHPGVVKRVERLLDDHKGKSITVRETADALRGQAVTFDQVEKVLTALHDAGALGLSNGGAYIIDMPEYANTRGARASALEALAWARATPDEMGECELLVATPADASALVADSYKKEFLDLRTAIRNIIASARSTILLAAPYWDLDVAIDLAEILRRRQQTGVRVAILARQPQSGSASDRALKAVRDILPVESASHLRILEQALSDDPFGTSTFHFKAACADAAQVYLGSANFNTAGLGSRWELGVLLGGRRARIVSEMLETLWASAHPF